MAFVLFISQNLSLEQGEVEEVEAVRGGLAFWLLDLCGQRGWVFVPWLFVFCGGCGGTDPAGAREAQGLAEC